MWVWILVAVVLLAIVVIYNTLVSRKNQVRNAFSSTDAFLKKRHDLIPNLVEAVRGAMTFEKSVLHDLTAMRAQAMSGQLSQKATVTVENQITRALAGIFVAVENYPALKSNQNVLHLQASLNDIEEQISAARRAYNAAVTDYNNAVEMFPTNIFASWMHYERLSLFSTPDEERRLVPVGALSDAAPRP
jgi:LemA protein